HEVSVKRHERRRALDAHLAPCRIELFGHDRRQPCPHPLASLDVLGNYGNGVIRVDPHKWRDQRPTLSSPLGPLAGYGLGKRNAKRQPSTRKGCQPKKRSPCKRVFVLRRGREKR